MTNKINLQYLKINLPLKLVNAFHEAKIILGIKMTQPSEV
jgi:hypothetical protein